MYKLTIRTNKCNLHEEIALADEARKFPCLYDKNSSDYKDESSLEEAWKVIEETLGFEQGDGARRFENLKKRYSKKRNDLKRATRRGTSRELAAAKHELEIYSFMNWLDPYIRPRCPKLRPALKEMEDEKPVIIVETKSLSSTGPEVSMPPVPDSSHTYCAETDHVSSVRTCFEDTGHSERINTELQVPLTRCIELRTNDRVIKSYESPVSGYGLPSRSSEAIPNASRAAPMNECRRIEEAATGASKDADALFGEIIVAELRNFPAHVKFLVKHEINEVIFKYQMKEYGNSERTATSSSIVSG